MLILKTFCNHPHREYYHITTTTVYIGSHTISTLWR